MTLYELKVNETGIIKDIHMDLVPKRRLLHLGLYPGVTITFIRIAPLRDPYAYIVSGNIIIIRKRDAMQIEIVKVLAYES